MEIIQNCTKHFFDFFYRKPQPNLQIVILIQVLVLHFCLPSDTFSVNFLSSSTPITFIPYVTAQLVLRQILIRMKRFFPHNRIHPLAMPFKQKQHLFDLGQHLFLQPVLKASIYQHSQLTKRIFAFEILATFFYCHPLRSKSK